MLTVILVIVLFVALIFPHELGHFLMARACRVQVNEFALGMGPAIFKKQGKETLYSIRAVPIGGFTAMEGEDTEEAGDNPRAFNNKKWWQKILILIAGAAMNVFIAFIALTVFCGVSGQATRTIESAVDGGPAAEAGLRAGDEIVAINGNRVKDWNNVSSELAKVSSADESVEVTVDRDGETLNFTIVPERSDDNRYVIGITSHVSHNVFIAVKNGAQSTVNLFRLLFKSIGDLFKTDNALDQVSGPVGIVKIVDESVQYGAMYYLYIVALISLNLAMINLLPLPALDGGRIIFVVIRLVTGKAISDKVERRVHAAGMIFLLLLAIVVTFNDVLRLFK